MRNKHKSNKKHLKNSQKKFFKKASGASADLKRKRRASVKKEKHIMECVGKISLTRDGYGFVSVENLQEDIFIPQKRLFGALNGDTVKVGVRKMGSDGLRMEGEVLEIVARSTKPYIGILQITGDQAWVIVENKVMPYDISVPITEADKKEQGKKVAVVIRKWKKGMDAPIGEIVDVLGEPGDNNTEMHAILAEYGLPYKFTGEVENAAAQIPVKIEADEIKNRRDFRDICTFTIDPADAKDFDDALSFRKLDGGTFEVGVHIADVTHYVRPNDIIDKEAVTRGTSVYLVDRTVPMLPEVLSNNLCSLRPDEEKLTFSAVFQMNEKAEVLDTWFGRTIICSDRRFAYEEAQHILEEAGLAEPSGTDIADIPDNRTAGSKREEEVKEAVVTLHKLAAIMRKKRFASGAISFDRPEMKVYVDEKGKPTDVKEKVSREANWLIEEFMLLANKAVATYVSKGTKLRQPTFVYRVHDEPDMDKIQNFKNFIRHFGYTMSDTKTGRQLAKELNRLLAKVQQKPECEAIEIIALRAMAKAKYSTDNIGHYGLGFRYYTHFTSPIRRYPDMMVHRLLAHYLAGGKSENKALFEQLCKQSSEREQIASDAERASIKYKLAEYMQERIGNIYDGTVSGVTEWGLYVEVEPTKVEGMVSIRDIKEDFFEFDEKNYCITGKKSKKKYTLGDKVRIRVLKVNLEQKTIDYELVGPADGVDRQNAN